MHYARYVPRPKGRPSYISSDSGVSSLPDVAPAGQHSSTYARWLGTNTGGYGEGDEFPPIPLEWIISPHSVDDGQCPSVSGTVGSFISSDLLSCLIAVILCYPPVLRFISCGMVKKDAGNGKRKKSNKVWLTWMLQFSLELLGNISNTLIVINSEGYEDLTFRNVFLLYTSRPRIKVWLFSILRFIQFEEGCVFADGYIGVAITEVILHTIMAAFVGITWGRLPNWEVREFMRPITTYLQTTPGILFVAITLVVPIWDRSDHTSWKSGERWCVNVFGGLFFATVYVASWVYWGFFLQLPGSL